MPRGRPGRARCRRLDRVVEVDLDVALRPDLEVEEGVSTEALEHVVEEGDPRRDVVLTGAVQIDPDPDVGLLGLAGDRRDGSRRPRPAQSKTWG